MSLKSTTLTLPTMFAEVIVCFTCLMETSFIYHHRLRKGDQNLAPTEEEKELLHFEECPLETVS